MHRLDHVLFSIHLFGLHGILWLAFVTLPSVAGLFVPRLHAVAWRLIEAVFVGNLVAYAAFILPLVVVILGSKAHATRNA